MQTRIVCEYSNAGDGFKSGPGSTGSLGGPAPPPQKNGVFDLMTGYRHSRHLHTAKRALGDRKLRQG